MRLPPPICMRGSSHTSPCLARAAAHTRTLRVSPELPVLELPTPLSQLPYILRSSSLCCWSCVQCGVGATTGPPTRLCLEISVSDMPNMKNLTRHAGEGQPGGQDAGLQQDWHCKGHHWLRHWCHHVGCRCGLAARSHRLLHLVSTFPNGPKYHSLYIAAKTHMAKTCLYRILACRLSDVRDLDKECLQHESISVEHLHSHL